jgi:hypothetical protein
MSDKRGMNGQNYDVRDVLHTEHGNDFSEYIVYRRTLGELGIDKNEGESFSDHELRQIFVNMQEGLFET